MTTASNRATWRRAARYLAIPDLDRRIAIRGAAETCADEAGVEKLPAARRSGAPKRRAA